MGLFAKDPEKEIERLRRACDERDEKYIDKCLKRGKESLIQTVRVLGEEQMDSYMPRLIELLSSGDADKRKAAAYALGEMRYSSAVPPASAVSGTRSRNATRSGSPPHRRDAPSPTRPREAERTTSARPSTTRMPAANSMA